MDDRRKSLIISVVLYLIISVVCKHHNDNDNNCPFLIAKCKSSCRTSNIHQCEKRCINNQENWKKLGNCPKLTDINTFDRACIEICTNDAECLYTDKCCPNGCGFTCQSPINLQHNIDLPDKPENLTINEKKSKKIRLTWNKNSDKIGDASNIYVLQARSHIGKYFSEQRLSDWYSHSFNISNGGLLIGGLKPAYWYEFRVAVVNNNGSKGFSLPTKAYTLSIGPKKPPAPMDLKVQLLDIEKNQVKWILTWKEPHGYDLPIENYKIFWARSLGESPGQGPLSVRKKVVGGDVHSFILNNLDLNSPYFLQVQALSLFGDHHLKGEKASISLNTTLPNVY